MKYVSWVENIQKRYRKSTVYECKSITEYKCKLNSQNFIYEIFVLQNSMEDICITKEDEKTGYKFSKLGQMIQGFLIKFFPDQFCNIYLIIASKK